jgi:hypothetical protein
MSAIEHGLADVAKQVGITYRQADFWATSGYINTTYESKTGAQVCKTPGSGYVRMLNDEEAAILRIMADLVSTGLVAKKAARLARQVVSSNRPVRVGKTLTLSIRDEVSA